jgi:hypothetical protein
LSSRSAADNLRAVPTKSEKDAKFIASFVLDGIKNVLGKMQAPEMTNVHK